LVALPARVKEARKLTYLLAEKGLKASWMVERLSDDRLVRASSADPFGAAPEMKLDNCS